MAAIIKKKHSTEADGLKDTPLNPMNSLPTKIALVNWFKK